MGCRSPDITGSGVDLRRDGSANDNHIVVDEFLFFFLHEQLDEFVDDVQLDHLIIDHVEFDHVVHVYDINNVDDDALHDDYHHPGYDNHYHHRRRWRRRGRFRR